VKESARNLPTGLPHGLLTAGARRSARHSGRITSTATLPPTTTEAVQETCSILPLPSGTSQSSGARACRAYRSRAVSGSRSAARTVRARRRSATAGLSRAVHVAVDNVAHDDGEPRAQIAALPGKTLDGAQEALLHDVVHPVLAVDQPAREPACEGDVLEQFLGGGRRVVRRIHLRTS